MAIKKITVNVDGDKLDALEMFLTGKGGNTETELVAYFETLYNKNVPANVRQFVERDNAPEIKVKKQKTDPSGTAQGSY
jgi:hypothetical protein